MSSKKRNNAESKAPRGSIIKKIMKIAIAVAVICAIIGILAVTGVFTHPSEKIVAKYYKAIAECDGQTIYELTFDPYNIELCLNQEYSEYKSEQDIIDENIKIWNDTKLERESTLGKNVRLDEFEIEHVTRYNKKEIEAINKYFAGREEYKNIKVQDIRVIRVEGELEGSKGEQDILADKMVYKVDGKWYIGSIGDLYDNTGIKHAINNVNP